MQRRVIITFKVVTILPLQPSTLQQRHHHNHHHYQGKTSVQRGCERPCGTLIETLQPESISLTLLSTAQTVLES